MPKVKKTVAQEEQLDEVFSNLEFTRRADELIGVIVRHYRMIEGRAVERDETFRVASKILKERLK